MNLGKVMADILYTIQLVVIISESLDEGITTVTFYEGPFLY